jgi:3-deoxy-D-manno-octulosonic-acid transferase
MATSGPPWAYRLVMATATRAVPLVGRFDEKVARGLAGRRGLAERCAAWAAASRDRRRPLVWFHAPSVGEGLQVKPVMEALRCERAGWQLAYSFYSPSAERLAASLAADFTDYLPFDRPAEVRAMLDALTPTALVYGKLDVWPELTLAAAARGVRLGLISATVAPDSSRLAWPARRWARPAYAALERVGAIAADDAGRLERLGARPEAVRITGDTRYDSVAERAARLDWSRQPLATLAAHGRERFTIVAGSTWPGDEAVLLPAFAELLATGDARLVLAPHEPTPAHLAAATATARRHGLPRPVRLSQLAVEDVGASPFVLVDRIGVLADLYAVGHVAYVGGGYHRAGLHSVLEPAVFGLPICFGPRWTGSRDAGLLLQRGAAVALPREGRTLLGERWQEWRRDPNARARAGRAAADVVREGRGATARTVALVRELVERGGYGAGEPTA